MHQKPRVHRPLPEWLAVRLDIPPDLFTGGMRLEMRGRQSLTVHGCRRILAYGPECMRLALKDATLTVRGSRLICTSYLGGAVGIDGQVDALCFLEEEENQKETEEKGAEHP